ncbi:MAG: C-terminal binding protein [Lachnospiraceae bacterium]|uniref:C-terminal binding protein n=1 Tax=Candidatus Weimeria bifida TaxID=2599074 RepID=A0A6N7IYJ4_9FIRM|nr:C-terminal binding protein [Candidatus Weimeria bifida]RRF95199.1 MAG: C-terminal binding protein [Lachnospiraceae bacterium]
MSKVLYFNIADNLDYENKKLSEWGIDDVELIEIKDKDYKKSFGEYLRDTGADGVVVEYDQVTREVIEMCPNLKIVSLQSIGYNNIDVDAATEHKICVCNIPGFCAPEVALHTVAMTLDLARKITFYDRSVQNGEWEPLYGYTLHRLTGKVFGMVFFGTIPKLVAPMIKAIGMDVLVYAPTKTKEYLAEFGCKKAETLDELLEKSDFVSLHCPLIEGVTYHLMDDAAFDKMKPTAFLINTSRGSVVDEAALVRALKQKKIQAAAIDVIEDEMNETSDLFGLDNCILTPHAAFISEDSFYEGRERALKNLVDRLSAKRDGRPESIVNPEVLE